jgi:poly-gamma-glutamate capsule biosynthesis protein CapA/YwtB (metallophosphatase superfamily)
VLVVSETVTLFLCGDVMTGRGVDQILDHPGNPLLQEPYVRDARTYLQAVESLHGPIRRPVPFSWPWGESLRVLADTAPDVRVINLETSVTTSAEFASGKDVHYRMHPRNVGVLAAANPDVCVLANNHMLDFGRRGLTETLRTLAAAGYHTAGAGEDAEQATRPAVVDVGDRTRVLVFAYGVASSGVPPGWAAAGDRSGVHYLPRLGEPAAAQVAVDVQTRRRPGDVVVVSLHWGANWVDEVPEEQIRFAHALVDAGVDVVHGHSCHHPLPIEIYRGRLILYGCGDFIDDYEGIPGHDEYRHDLRVLYFPTVRRADGELVGMRIVPMRPVQMRLRRAEEADCRWLQALFAHDADQFGTRVRVDTGGALVPDCS